MNEAKVQLQGFYEHFLSVILPDGTVYCGVVKSTNGDSIGITDHFGPTIYVSYSQIQEARDITGESVYTREDEE